MNPRANIEISMVGYLGILVASVKRQIGQDYSNPGRWILFGITFTSLFLVVSFSLLIETRTKH